MKHNYWLLCHIILVSLKFSSLKADPQSCAILRPSDSHGESLFTLKDGSAMGNLADEYFTADKNLQVPGIWRVSPSCHLKACDGVYFTGNCTTFSVGTQSPSQTWLSSSCRCKSDCSCSKVTVRQAVCGHAYFQSGGCNNCNAAYTELAIGTNDIFPEIWSSNITTFLVRPGCTLTVYEEENLEGKPEVISDFVLKKWSEPVNSYECSCEDTTFTRNPETVETSSFPRQLDIPESMEDVLTNLSGNNFNHSGLLSALSSLTKRRSSKNLYMLMIGSSGAGKSSAINNLLGRNLTLIGDHISITSEILEFRIPLPIPELGVGNSELRVIDTPGLGDTRGLDNDALFLATLEHYLSSHEELRKRIPNLVLIFHNFQDNRFDGEGSPFVKMIRGLDSIRSRVTDETFSNVLFVFSHLCSGDKSLQKNPSPTLLRFKDVIERYTFFPKPVITLAIENKGADNELIMRNGQYELPNQEYFPGNLFQKLDQITRAGGDRMGNAIVNKMASSINYFEDPDLNITLVAYPMVMRTHGRVPKYLEMLSLASHSIKDTEVSLKLAQHYGNLNSSTKAKFPNELERLQRYLNLKGIKTVSDVPRTSTAILELVSGIQENEVTSYLLDTGLNLKAPPFPGSTVAGYSFDIQKNSLLPVSPFNHDNPKLSSVGYLLPEIITCTKSLKSPEQPVDTFNKFDSKQSYFQDLIRTLLGDNLKASVNSTEIFSALTRNLKEGYFVPAMASCSNGTKNCFTVTRFYKTFEFNLLDTSNRQDFLQPSFLRRLENLGAPIVSSQESIEEWISFFNDIGTHVVTSAEGGGRIDIQFSIPNEVLVDGAVKQVLKCLDFVEDPLGSVSKYKEDSKSAFSGCAAIDHKLAFRGGNPAYHTSDISKMTLDQAVELITNWKKSLHAYPTLFPKQILPIGEVVQNYVHRWDRNGVKRKAEKALGRLMSSTLKYAPPTPDPRILEEREDEEERVLKLLEEQKKQNDNNLKALEKERIKKKEEMDKQKQKDFEDKQRMEQQARSRAEQRADEKAAAAKRRFQELKDMRAQLRRAMQG